MATPVFFLEDAILDVERFIPEASQDELILEIADRLSRYPLIGIRLPAPDAYARTHLFGKWRVFYEPIYDAEDEIERVNVLRIVPRRSRLK